MAWTAPRTWTNGETPSKAVMDTHIRDNQLFLKGSHGCKLYSSVASTTLTTATDTVTAFDRELWDTDGFHSTSSQTSRITIPTGFDGAYLVMGQVVFAGVLGRRYIGFGRNGTIAGGGFVRHVETPQDNLSSVFSVAGVMIVAAGDYLELVLRQDSGGNLSWAGGSESQTSAAVTLIGT